MVGYIITGVLGLGLLIALERLDHLRVCGDFIRSQLKNVGSLKKSNLGPILLVYLDKMMLRRTSSEIGER